MALIFSIGVKVKRDHADTTDEIQNMEFLQVILYKVQ